MSKQGDETVERLEAAASRRARKGAGAAKETAIRSDPVRINADLLPAEHRAMQYWQLKAAEDLDWVRVTNNQLIRAVVHVLTDKKNPSAAEFTDVVKQALRDLED